MAVREKRGVDAPRHLFVDGYNILHAWRWLGGRAEPELEVARARLIETVRAVRDGERIEVTLVFDGRGSATVRDVAASEPGFAVVFAPAGRTADAVIEMLVASAPNPQACLVATADSAERETVQAAGATCLAPDELLAWSERCRARIAQAALRRSGRENQAWGNRLPL